MARRPRRSKPLLPELGTLLLVLALIGSILGLVWFAGQNLRVIKTYAPANISARR